MGIRVVAGVTTGDPTDVERSVTALRSTAPGTEVVRLGATGGAGYDELIRHRADALVLVEAGAVVAPRCIALLVDAMQRTGAGMAGPSTNLAWNEQSAVAAVGREPRAGDREAGLLLRRFGYAVRALDPPTLGDFCLAVRREVVAAIGGADPAYGDGPRWELDYGARAAAAGLAGIWVCGAYVWRPWRPRPVPRRVAPGADLAQRLHPVSDTALSDVPRAQPLGPPPLTPAQHQGFSGQSPRSHPGPQLAPPVIASPHTQDRVAVLPASGGPSSPRAPGPPASARPRAPLVSCVMPTRERAQFACQAVRYFLAQDYPNLELVVVEDGPPQLAAMLPVDARIRLVNPTARPARQPDQPLGPPTGHALSIGALRNLGVGAAHGDIVVLWDDDDWHGPTRISAQVAPILAGTADVTGLALVPWFEPQGWQCWQVAPASEQALLRRGVYGGTIAFRRALWQRAPFPDRSLAEDADFLDSAVRSGARLHRLDGRGRYVYVRHDRNSWQVRRARLRGWTPLAPASLPGPSAADLAFYADLRAPQPASSPLVSCIMPTRDRRAYVPHAIDYFLRQTHDNAELIVVDDGTDPVADLIPAQDSIRYHRLDRPLVLGAKRNLACELAAGEVIAHWDDDDWQAPDRLAVQVAALAGAELCGASRLLFWDPTGGCAWRYSWPRGRRPWAAGTSLCYPRHLWRRRAFSEVAVGEDTRFVWQAEIRRLADVADARCVVALVHPGNTVPKTGRGTYWTTVDITEVVERLGTDVARYTRRAPTARTARPVGERTAPDPRGSSISAALGG